MAERNLLHRLLGPPYRRVRAAYRVVSGPLSVLRTLAHRELTRGLDLDLPWRRRLWLYRRGFISESGVVYDIDEENYRDIVSDLLRERANDITDPWGAAVSNMLTFTLLFEAFSEHLPELYGLVDDGALVRNSPSMTAPSWESDGSAPVNAVRENGVVRFEATAWIDAHLEETEALVLKPVYGYGGRGFIVCRKLESADGYDVNGETKTAEEFAALLQELEEYLAWEFIRPGEYLDRIYPGATGAVRVMTMWDYERDEPFVAGAGQRIGSDRSAPIDSTGRGGLTAEVSDAGELGRAARWYPDRGEVRWYETHPDTGARIEGTRVPGWPTIRERILEIAATFPFLPRLGWDVVVTGEGEFVVLEVNAHAGYRTVQMHRPLLRDPRVRRFYAHHGCL